jgi:hypothetical protein
MERPGRYPQTTVDTRVLGRRYPLDVDPLHEGQRASTATVKEHVLHMAALGHQQLLMDNHAKAQLTFIKAASGRQFVASKAEMVECHYY